MEHFVKILCVIGMVFLIHGKVFAAENFNAEEASLEAIQTTEASLPSLSDEPVSIDEEIEDEEAVDTDA